MIDKILKLFNRKPIQGIMLGRWNLKHDNAKKEIITMFYSNTDHCGDVICGNIIENKKILENKLKALDNSKTLL